MPVDVRGARSAILIGRSTRRLVLTGAAAEVGATMAVIADRPDYPAGQRSGCFQATRRTLPAASLMVASAGTGRWSSVRS